MGNPDIDRFIALSKVRSRYWWILGTMGLFYLALSARLSSVTSDTGEILFPLIPGIPIDARVVWASGPAVLAFLLMGILGAFRARLSVIAKLEASADTTIEEELVPTFIDVLVYEPRESWWLWRMLKQFIYPIALSLFFLEAVFILVKAWMARSSIPYWPVLLAIGALSILVVLPGLCVHWFQYFHFARAIRQGKA